MQLIAELGIGPREVGRARRAMARTLRQWDVGDGTAEVAVLLTSELVTNAIRHGTPPIAVLAGLDGDGALRVEVRDDGPGDVQPRRPAPDDDGGRGLLMVESLADRWGSRNTRSGKRVWFEVSAS